MDKTFLGMGNKFKAGSVCSDLEVGSVFKTGVSGQVYTTYEKKLNVVESRWEIKTLENGCIFVYYGSRIMILV